MLAELSGFTLARTIPDSALLGVMSGAYKVCGGVIRNNSGEIVAHLVNASSSANFMQPLLPINTIIGGLNTYQLSRIGTSVTKLLSLANGTMTISGLTLSVSAIGFLFLNNKLNRIDEQLKEIGKDIKYIRDFLDLQERGKLITALKSLNSIRDVPESLKENVLINSMQTLSDIHHKYRISLTRVDACLEALPIEEYYIITALGHALCASELGMYDFAEKELQDAYDIWKKEALKFSKKINNNPDMTRFMEQRYVQHLKSDELIEWYDFSRQTDKGIEWIDDIRKRLFYGMNFFATKEELDKGEKIELGFMKKILHRDKILNGYIDQYKYLAKIKKKPSEVQEYIDNLPEESSFENAFVFLSNEILNPA